MTSLALCLSTLIGCLVGSFVPVINTEIIVLTAAASAPASMLLPLILIASSAQMVAKCALYFVGSGLLRLPRGRFASRIDAALAKAGSRRGSSSAVLFASATTGVPPFYVMSVASGALKVGFSRFVIVGFIGRTLRFSALVLIPYLIKAVF
jgi:membrane protein YqaA with SNARE-associated domain